MRPATDASERRPVTSCCAAAAQLPSLPEGFVTTNAEYSPNVASVGFVTRTRYAPGTSVFVFVCIVPCIVQNDWPAGQDAPASAVQVGASAVCTTTFPFTSTVESVALEAKEQPVTVTFTSSWVEPVAGETLMTVGGGLG